MRPYHAIMVLLIVGVILLSGCTQTRTDSADIQVQEDISQKTADKEDIRIEAFSFNPQVITIKKGALVTWTNYDSVKHTISADNGLFDSEVLAKGESWTYTFVEAGNYSYHCTLHPTMTGEIRVE